MVMQILSELSSTAHTVPPQRGQNPRWLAGDERKKPGSPPGPSKRTVSRGKSHPGHDRRARPALAHAAAAEMRPRRCPGDPVTDGAA
jgi:hypothetical protein